MKKRLLLIIPVICILCGCYDTKEPNNIAYVVAIGIDMTDDKGVYDYTIQFAKTTQISGGASEEGGKEGSQIVEVINVKAPTVYSAVNIANQVVSKSFTLAHTKLIVMSEELAKTGVKDLFDTFGRNSDIRPNIYVAVSSGKAKDYIDSIKPIVEINPVTYYRLIFESESGGYVPRVLLKDFYFQIDDEDKQNVLPLAGVNEKNKKKAEEEEKQSGLSNGGQENKQEENGNENNEGQENNIPEAKVNKKGFDYLTKDYYAGKIDVEKKNASEVIGMAVFDGEKMVGKMDNIDSLIYNILQGNYKISYTSFYNENSPDIPVTIGITQHMPPRISVNTKGDAPIIKVKVYMNGQLMSESVDNPVDGDIKGIERQVEEETEKAIEDFLIRTRDEFGADIIGFGQYAKANFLTYNDYEKYDWRSQYLNAEFEVNAEFKLKNVGFIDLSSKGR